MPRSDLVAIFPGQGSLAAHAGVPWAAHDAFDTVDAVGDAAGRDVRRLLLDADDVELVETDNAQLATFALSLCILAATRLAASCGWMLGHSLGEYSALVGAHALSLDDGARLVRERGTAMRDAAAASPGGLTALVGGDAASATALCAAVDDLFVANRNGPDQIVVGGTSSALELAATKAREFGFRRAIALRVGGAFHTPLMASAAPSLTVALDSATFRRTDMRVVANVDGKVHDDPAEWPGLLVAQLTTPVDFEACVQTLPGDATVVECGPGGVLAGLIRRIRDDVHCVTIGTPEDLDALEAVL